MPRIAYDHRAVTIDGRRTLLFSGAVHYPRSTPGLWPLLMKRSREAGLNTLETYVFWNLHEARRGVYDFSDRLDLVRFCEVAGEHGLHVILRIGPYICAETQYGGFPAWLREVPGIRMRDDNEPFKREKERWVRHLCGLLRDRGLFAPMGGPIIMAQIENEYDNVARNYGEAGPRYLAWCNALARDLDLGVPWIMCLAHGGDGSAEGVIATINAFHGHQRLDDHFAKRPHQPALWTENWPGWYDTWGYAHHQRPATDVAYGVARFFAAGGAGVNYYMWHGGTNFARESMYLQTTSYDFDAPLDEFGLTTTKSAHLAALHRLLADHADLLLDGERAQPVRLGQHQSVYVYGKGTRQIAFVCNDDRQSAAAVPHDGGLIELSPGSVKVLAGSQTVYDSAAIARRSRVTRRMRPMPAETLEDWRSWSEPMPGPTGVRHVARMPTLVAPRPIEQLGLTRDESDYCWYSATLRVDRRSAGRGRLTLRGVADLVHVYVDGTLAASSPTPLREDRGTFDGPGWTQEFELRLEPGDRSLSLLCCAVGWIKGDWQIGQQNMALERKGLFGRALWNGKAIAGPWSHAPGLVGEAARVFDAGAAILNWKSPGRSAQRRPLTWWRADFDRPARSGPGGDPLAIDLTGMNKGLLWLNGRCAGRYWLCPVAASGIAQWQSPALTQTDTTAPHPVPTQRYWHLPLDWLEDVNSLTLFEEVGGDPRPCRLVRRR